MLSNLCPTLQASPVSSFLWGLTPAAASLRKVVCRGCQRRARWDVAVHSRIQIRILFDRFYVILVALVILQTISFWGFAWAKVSFWPSSTVLASMLASFFPSFSLRAAPYGHTSFSWWCRYPAPPLFTRQTFERRWETSGVLSRKFGWTLRKGWRTQLLLSLSCCTVTAAAAMLLHTLSVLLLLCCCLIWV